MNTDCNKCKYGIVHTEPVKEILKIGGNEFNLNLSKGSVYCNSKNIKNINITNGKVICSSYCERGVGK